MNINAINDFLTNSIESSSALAIDIWKVIIMVLGAIYFISALGDYYHGDSQGNYFIIFTLLPFSFIAAYGFACLSHKTMLNEGVFDRKFAVVIHVITIAVLYKIYLRIDLLPMVAPVIFTPIITGYFAGIRIFLNKNQTNKIKNKEL